MKNPKVILLGVISLLAVVATVVIAWAERKPKVGRPPKPEAGSDAQMEQARKARTEKLNAINGVQEMAQRLDLRQPDTQAEIDEWLDDFTVLCAECNRISDRWPDKKIEMETLIEGLDKKDYGTKEKSKVVTLVLKSKVLAGILLVVIVVAWLLRLSFVTNAVAGMFKANPESVKFWADVIHNWAMTGLMAWLAFSVVANPLFAVLFGITAITIGYHAVRKHFPDLF